ncbi:hypothetical protein ACNKHK_05825 [Shigella flexneri]
MEPDRRRHGKTRSILAGEPAKRGIRVGVVSRGYGGKAALLSVVIDRRDHYRRSG